MSIILSRLGDHPLILRAGSDYFDWASAGAISANRLLILDTNGHADYFDLESLDYPAILGVSTTATATAGDLVGIRRSGQLTDNAWSWQPGLPIFAGGDGFLTQVAPETGWLLILGHALTASQMQLDIGEVIR